MSEGPLI